MLWEGCAFLLKQGETRLHCLVQDRWGAAAPHWVPPKLAFRTGKELLQPTKHATIRMRLYYFQSKVLNCMPGD